MRQGLAALAATGLVRRADGHAFRPMWRRAASWPSVAKCGGRVRIKGGGGQIIISSATGGKKERLQGSRWCKMELTKNHNTRRTSHAALSSFYLNGTRKAISAVQRNQSVREIARQIGRSPSSISREIETQLRTGTIPGLERDRGVSQAQKGL